jgi:hypothetical protein
LRTYHRDVITKKLVSLFRDLSVELESLIDWAEVEASRLVTEANQADLLTVENAKRVFQTIEREKHGLKEVSERLIGRLDTYLGQVKQKKLKPILLYSD